MKHNDWTVSALAEEQGSTDGTGIAISSQMSPMALSFLVPKLEIYMSIPPLGVSFPAF